MKKKIINQLTLLYFKSTVSGTNVFRYLYVFLCSPRFQLISCSRLQCCFLVHQFFIARVALFFVLGFFCINYRILSFYCNFRVSSSFSCAWSSLQFNVSVFARPSISSLSRYRLNCMYLVCFIRNSSLPYSFRSVRRLFYLDFVFV